MTWHTYFTGTQENIEIANNQISENAGLPFGGTDHWADLEQNYSDPTTYFIKMPEPDGWIREDGMHFTQEQMINGVENVTIEESQPDWFPPPD